MCRGWVRRFRRGSERGRPSVARRFARHISRRSVAGNFGNARFRLVMSSLVRYGARRESVVSDSSAGGAADAFQHRQRGDDEGVMRGDELGEVGAGALSAKRCASPSAPASIASRASCCLPMWTTAILPRLWAASIKAFSVSLLSVGRWPAVGAGVVDDDLDVVRALGDAGVDPGLRLGGRRERRNLECRTRCRGRRERSPECPRSAGRRGRDPCPRLDPSLFAACTSRR